MVSLSNHLPVSQLGSRQVNLIMKVTAIIPAAGAGSRIAKRKGLRKPFFIVRGKPILIHALLALEASVYIENIIVVVHKDDIDRAKKAFKKFKLRKVVSTIAGGKTRYESVKKALSCLSGDSDTVLIHDGVRPLIDGNIIKRVIEARRRYGAAVCGVPVLSTVKLIDRSSNIKRTPLRKTLYMAQTPQVFKKDIILKAYKSSRNASGITDDSMLVEKLGYKVRMVPGSYYNIKVTTVQDLILARELLRKRGSL